VRHLRDFGFGKSSMEETLHVEVEKLVELLGKRAGQAQVLDGALNISVINALWVMMVGEKMELEDPKLHRVTRTINSLLKDTFPQSPLAFVLPYPTFLKMPLVKNFSGAASIEAVLKEFHDLMTPLFEAHLDELDPESPRDLLDIMLDKMQKSADDRGSCFAGQPGMDNILNVFLDLFMGGLETTASTMIWTFLYLLYHPDVQERVAKEIFKVVGRDRLPGLVDQDKMPYTNAVIQESLRFSSFVPLAVGHFTTHDIPVGDYIIPANSILMPNLCHVLHDPEYWKNPEEFNPDRFMDAEGRFVKDERVVAFSLGKRYCPGQSLAEKELFLFFTGIVQKFRMRPAEGSELPGMGLGDTDPIGVVRCPPAYDVILEFR